MFHAWKCQIKRVLQSIKSQKYAFLIFRPYFFLFRLSNQSGVIHFLATSLIVILIAIIILNILEVIRNLFRLKLKIINLKLYFVLAGTLRRRIPLSRFWIGELNAISISYAITCIEF